MNVHAAGSVMRRLWRGREKGHTIIYPFPKKLHFRSGASVRRTYLDESAENPYENIPMDNAPATPALIAAARDATAKKRRTQRKGSRESTQESSEKGDTADLYGMILWG